MASKLPMRPLRIEDELYEKVCRVAKAEMRSFNSEVAYILEQFIKDYEAKHGPIQTNAQGE